MPKFSYEAKKGPKEVVSGTIEAPNQNAAVDKLTHMGYVPIRVFPEHAAPVKEKIPSRPTHRTAHPEGTVSIKVRARDITIFTEQLASLVKSRVPLLEAMKILHDQTDNINLKKIIDDIRKQIKDGKTLTQSLSKYPKVFPTLYVNMVNSGETGGILEKTLLRLADFRNKEEEVRAKIGSALAYPAFIILVGIGTIFVLLGFVIPRMATLFTEIGQSLPLPTKILLDISENVKSNWYWGLLVIVLVVVVLKRSNQEGKKEKEVIDRLKLKIPLVGGFIKESIIARFSRTLSLLIANGIPLFQAIKITIPTIENEIFKTELEQVHKGIVDGMSLEQSMKRSKWFPGFMSNMLAVGERGGSLEEALQEVATFYERNVDKTTTMMTSLIEPAIILVMGLVVGFIVFAMLLPIFQINLGMQ
ncbi:MAG: type II secretion system F family protein [Candidatus Omnitrophica bacterium]|nr:type II secretion system F family protein [Candidatus Omnitrophota bacterium]